MPDAKQLTRIQKGSSAWNKWREQNPDILPDLRKGNLRRAKLSGADLSGTDLSGTNLSWADLSGADLSGANLIRSDLSWADLSGADLSGANLIWANLSRANLFVANLSRANLSGADLTGANLFVANLSRAQLSGADLSDAGFGETIFVNVDLSSAKGLEKACHRLPSTISIDTLYKSKGRIPEEFLRGVGVPDNFIIFGKSLATNPVEFYSCFISYSTKDQDFADRLFADLQAKGVRCWFAPHHAQRGRKLHEQIDEAIRIYDKLLLILSRNSMNSDWVKTEIGNARARERQEGVQMLFPVSIVAHSAIRRWKCFDADSGTDSAREIREYLIGDFSKWKDHDSYQKEFDILVRDLQSKRKIPTATSEKIAGPTNR